MSDLIDTLLLLALPASGKSEIRRYLDHVDARAAQSEFHMGPTVQLDDYPYVHMMRRISQELREMGEDGVFFDADSEPMKEPLDWGTLIELVNQDYADVHAHPRIEVLSASAWLFDRLDGARERVGATPALRQLRRTHRTQLEMALEREARQLLQTKLEAIPSKLEGRTIVIEFARGGSDGSEMPLPAPVGYAYSLGRLSEQILRRASILYVWVTPEESRRKNEERGKPGREGDASILHHGVPIKVMMEDYGTDDMGYLIETSDRPDTVRVEAHGHVHHLPVARFDNRVDKTSFLRADPSQWSDADVAAVRDGLRGALSRLVQTSRD
jgi:hypothetical protein